MPRHHHYNEPLSSGQEEAFLPSGGLSNKDKIFMTRRKERRGKKEKGFSDADRGYYLMWASGLVNSPISPITFSQFTMFRDWIEQHMLVHCNLQFWNLPVFFLFRQQRSRV